jgi:hypothetical protein
MKNIKGLGGGVHHQYVAQLISQIDADLPARWQAGIAEKSRFKPETIFHLETSHRKGNQSQFLLDETPMPFSNPLGHTSEETRQYRCQSPL